MNGKGFNLVPCTCLCYYTDGGSALSADLHVIYCAILGIASLLQGGKMLGTKAALNPLVL